MAMIRNFAVYLIGTLTAVIFFGVSATEATNKRIAIIMNPTVLQQEESLFGFKLYFQKQGVRADYDPYFFEETKPFLEMQNIIKSKPNLILALGSPATEKAINEIPDIPILAGMLLRIDSFKKASNVTGVILEFPIETQLKWLQHILPKNRNVGTIYDPRENYDRIMAASKIALKMGLEFDAQGIVDPKELPGALIKLSKKSDVFWGIPDALVLNAQTVKHILLFSFQNRIPFIGFSPSWVKAGALYSLNWDYTDIGMQCGETALKILQGSPVQSIPTATPRKVSYVLNLTTANHMKIEVSDELIRGAQQIF
jgi:putative ABC transport system substrate-binding protein